MVAVVRQEVVFGALERGRDGPHRGFELRGGEEGEALEEGAAKKRIVGDEVRAGAVDACGGGVGAVGGGGEGAEGVFAVERGDDDAGVEEGGAEMPEGGGELAWLCGGENISSRGTMGRE